MPRRYIRHHSGTIHDVSAETFNAHLAQAGQIQYKDKEFREPAREATPDEIVAYWARQGLVYDAATDEARPPEPVAPEAKGKAGKAE